MSYDLSTRDVRAICQDYGWLDEFDDWLESVKRENEAAVLRTFARSIDLEAIADEWATSADPTARDDQHWAAGNAASTVQNRAFDVADQIEREAPDA